MVTLTDTQLIVLLKAAARQDGAAVVPPKMNKAAESNVHQIGGRSNKPETAWVRPMPTNRQHDALVQTESDCDVAG